ncbi:unnamed protein product [Polarella glacialis]|uniref:Uncharacterized protein n=2 Tax=Polarella glacialis TaxID=89957 RepID=A0A813LGK5_POLGL|nr:unnamed protein product [Polarella glacialis]
MCSLCRVAQARGWCRVQNVLRRSLPRCSLLPATCTGLPVHRFLSIEISTLDSQITYIFCLKLARVFYSFCDFFGAEADAPPVVARALSGAAQAFLAKLPSDSFKPEEENLREVLVSALERGSLLLSQVKLNAKIIGATKAFLPGSVSIEDWIERRIGAEVSLVTNEQGQRVCVLNGSPAEDDTREAFFASLPRDSFSREEERLRLAIFDFLAAWSSQELATLAHAGGDRNVQDARKALLGPGDRVVSMREWVERRIGGELSLKHGDEIHLHPVAKPLIAERVALLHARMPPPMPPMAPRMPPVREPRERRRDERDSGEGAEANRVKFFSALPSEELTDTELQLREVLLDQMERFCAQHPGKDGPLLSEIAQDKALQKLRSKLLPGQVSLREWIDRRIGGEIASRQVPNGQVQILSREAMDKSQSSRGGKRDRSEAPVRDQDEGNREAEKDVAEKREAFFASLSADGFAPEEEALRDAILTFLETWTGADAPLLTKLGEDSQVQGAKQAFFKKSRVSLKAWIDRRIGGEVATWRADPRSPDVAVGLREQWGEVAAAALAEEAAGAGSKRPKTGKGKGAGKGR